MKDGIEIIGFFTIRIARNDPQRLEKGNEGPRGEFRGNDIR